MHVQIVPCNLETIQPLRVLFLHERNFQFVLNKCHDFGWADTYLFTADGVNIGYGSVWKKEKKEENCIFEFYVLPPFRKFSADLFPLFQAACGTALIECQTNDTLLCSLLYEFAKDIHAEAILFEDDITTTLAVADVNFRKQDSEDGSTHVLVRDEKVLATGGFVWNYNMPYIDIYMQVEEPYRQQGLGSLIVQELKKEAYLLGRVPAARCNINNLKSKATLVKAGFKVCGYRVKGTFIKEI